MHRAKRGGALGDIATTTMPSLGRIEGTGVGGDTATLSAVVCPTGTCNSTGDGSALTTACSIDGDCEGAGDDSALATALGDLFNCEGAGDDSTAATALGALFDCEGAGDGSAAATACSTGVNSEDILDSSAAATASSTGVHRGGAGDGSAAATAHNAGVQLEEEEDCTIWFYNWCLIACITASSTLTALKLATSIMRLLKSAYGNEEAIGNTELSDCQFQKLQMQMFSHPSLSVFHQADVSLFSDACNRTSRLLNTRDFDEKTLQAIDAWTDMQRASREEQAPKDAVDGCYPKSNDESDESSFQPSGDDDDDSDNNRKPAVKSPRKGGSNEEQYDDDIFEDDEEEGDLTYFRSTTQGKRGRRLLDGGPPRPDTSGMTDEAAKMTLQQWRVNRKAHTDKQERLRRKEMRSGGQLGTNHTGVLSSRLCIMTEVESSPLLVNHTFLTRELLNLRISKEANLYGCNITVKRSDDFRLAVVGSKDSLFHTDES